MTEEFEELTNEERLERIWLAVGLFRTALQAFDAHAPVICMCVHQEINGNSVTHVIREPDNELGARLAPLMKEVIELSGGQIIEPARKSRRKSDSKR